MGDLLARLRQGGGRRVCPSDRQCRGILPAGIPRTVVDCIPRRAGLCARGRNRGAVSGVVRHQPATDDTRRVAPGVARSRQAQDGGRLARDSLQAAPIGIYKAFFYALTHWVLPTAIMFWLFSWLAFGTANTLGLVCKGADEIELRDVATAENAEPIVMKTSNACGATGVKVTEGRNYRITLIVRDPWKDATIDTDPNGF